MHDFAQRTEKFFASNTKRLTLTYLAIIMTMSLGFTLVIYSTSVARLEHRLPSSSEISYPIFRTSPNLQTRIEDFLLRRVDDEKTELAWQLVNINLVVLFVGSIISYYLARRTLQPIEAAIKSKDQFISDASHELRTPLTALQTTNEVALRKKTLNLQEAKQLIGENVEEIKHLQDLTNGLLSLLKETTEEVELKKVLLKNAAQQAIENIQAQAKEKQIVVSNELEKASAISHEPTIAQVLTILLDNAIKYSPEKSTVKISSRKLRKYLAIDVEDKGIGISKQDKEHIFDRFYRADQSRKRQKANGHGLGLAIAKKQLEKINGDITLKSKPVKGSTFTIMLPNSNE